MIRTNLLDDRNGIIRAYFVSELQPRLENVLIIGMATGAWAQVIAHAPGVRRVTIVEINPGYLRVVKKYPEVASLLHNPKVEIVIDDGRRWLARNKYRRFDAIVSNTTFHWRSHSTNLLSVEFLRLIRAHLKPGGMYFFNATGSPEATKTALQTFPYGLRFRYFVAVSDAPFNIDGDRWARTLSHWYIDGRPVLDRRDARGRRKLDSLASAAVVGSGLAVDLEGRESILERLPDVRVVTDDNMGTEWQQVFPQLWMP